MTEGVTLSWARRLCALVVMGAAAACANSEAPTLNRSLPSASQSERMVVTRVETPTEIRRCRALSGLRPVHGIENPCAQARHLHALFRRNAQYARRDGFTLAFGKLGRFGLRLMVDGDIQDARLRFADDDLVFDVHSRNEGFPDE
jgi:hypothetical protein